MSDPSDEEKAEALRWLLSFRPRTDALQTLPAAVYGAPPVRERTEYDVVLETAPATVRMAIVKWLRARRPELSLADALALVARPPNTVVQGLCEDDAVDAVRELLEMGASARLR